MGLPSTDEIKAQTASRLVAIDLLRGVASLAVVVTHLPFSWKGGVEHDVSEGMALPLWVTSFTNYGSYGVNLFLVISGFCIHMQWARTGEGRDVRSKEGPKVRFFDFWKRRLRRLYPPYFVALVASLAGLAVIAHLSGGHGQSVASLFGYPSNRQLFIDVVLLLLLTQNVNNASARVGNGPFWSLALEEQLYMLYFPFLAIRRRWGWRPALILVVGVTLAWRAVFAFTPTPPEFWYVVGPARWLEWTLGALAVEAFLGRIELSRWLASPITLAASAIASVLVMPPYVTLDQRLWTPFPGAAIVNDVLFSFTAFVLVNWFCQLDRKGVFRDRRIPSVFARVGIFSYSLYLVHNPVMVVVKRVAIGLGIHSVVAIVILRLGSAIFAGWLFFRLVESFFLTKSRPLRMTEPSVKSAVV